MDGEKYTVIASQQDMIEETINNFVVAGIIITLEEMSKVRHDLTACSGADLIRALLSSTLIRMEIEGGTEYSIGRLTMN